MPRSGPSKSDACCKPSTLKQRRLLSPIQAGGLASVFKVLANDTRLRLVHAIVRSDEQCVTDLATTLGMRPQAISNQLQRLLDLGIVAARRDGNNVYYRIVNGCVEPLLGLALCLTESNCSTQTSFPPKREARA